MNSLVDFLATDVAQIEGEIANAGTVYPTAYVRVLLCVEALERLDFGEDAAHVDSQWRSQYPRHGLTEFESDIARVVEAMLGASLACEGLDQALLQVPKIRFSTTDWKMAQEGALGRPAEMGQSITTIDRWIAAARYLYDRRAEDYVKNGSGATFMEDVGRLIERGERGEVGVGSLATDALRQKDGGQELFAQFERWATSGSRGGRADRAP